MNREDNAPNRLAAIARCAASFVLGAAITRLLLLEPAPATSTHQSGGGTFFLSVLLGGLHAGIAVVGAALMIAKASRGAGQLILALALGGVATAAWVFFL